MINYRYIILIHCKMNKKTIDHINYILRMNSMRKRNDIDGFTIDSSYDIDSYNAKLHDILKMDKLFTDTLKSIFLNDFDSYSDYGSFFSPLEDSRVYYL